MFSTCNNCDSSCFPTPASCVEWNGGNHTDLGIYQNDSIVVVIESLIAEIKRIGDIVDDCKFCSSPTEGTVSNVNLPAPKYGVGTNYTNNSYAVQSIPINYNIQRGTSQHSFSYNLLGFEGALPSNAEIIDVNVEAISAKTGSVTNTLYTSSEKTGGFNISPTNLPAEVSIRTKVRTEEGDVILNKSVSLTGAEEGVFQTEMDVNTFTNVPSEVTADQYNELISSELAKLKREVATLKAKM